MYKINSFIKKGLVISKLSAQAQKNIENIKILSEDFLLNNETAKESDNLFMQDYEEEILAAMPKKTVVKKKAKSEYVLTPKKNKMVVVRAKVEVKENIVKDRGGEEKKIGGELSGIDKKPIKVIVTKKDKGVFKKPEIETLVASINKAFTEKPFKINIKEKITSGKKLKTSEKIAHTPEYRNKKTIKEKLEGTFVSILKDVTRNEKATIANKEIIEETKEIQENLENILLQIDKLVESNRLSDIKNIGKLFKELLKDVA